MPRPPDILREVERLARKRGWSQQDLARQLGVNRTLLSHLRSGKRIVTLRLLAQMTRVFGDAASVKDCAWAYLRFELPVTPEEAGVLPIPPDAVSELDPRARQALRRFVRQFPHHLVDGRGLLVVGESASLLSVAAAFIADTLRDTGVRVVQRRAHEAVLPSEAALMRRARLVVLERAEFASAAVQDLLAERLDLERPVMVTTARDLAGTFSPDVVRVLSARCTRVVLTPAPSSDE